jgi:hypothetical protein
MPEQMFEKQPDQAGGEHQFVEISNIRAAAAKSEGEME